METRGKIIFGGVYMENGGISMETGVILSAEVQQVHYSH